MCKSFGEMDFIIFTCNAAETFLCICYSQFSFLILNMYNVGQMSKYILELGCETDLYLYLVECNYVHGNI